MKKLIILIVAITFGLGLSAQETKDKKMSRAVHFRRVI